LFAASPPLLSQQSARKHQQHGNKFKGSFHFLIIRQSSNRGGTRVRRSVRSANGAVRTFKPRRLDQGGNWPVGNEPIESGGRRPPGPRNLGRDMLALWLHCQSPDSSEIRLSPGLASAFTRPAAPALSGVRSAGSDQIPPASVKQLFAHLTL
jgi:hypothetical protein